MSPVVTVPIAANAELFRWQLDLFWFAHQRIYGPDATQRAHAVLVNCNDPDTPRINRMPWPITVPHTVCYSVYDYPDALALPENARRLSVPLNIQLGLMQVLPRFADDQIIELTDCDMVHVRPCPITSIADNELYVSAIYEDWHLFSRSSLRHIIERYFENGGAYYNGGFCPIIGRASTFRRLLPEWIAVHLDILRQPYELNWHWWAGMYALQAACEKNRVQMVDRDLCYVPGANTLMPQHYTTHYCVDPLFNKRTYPHVDADSFPNNAFYSLVQCWTAASK